MSQVTNYTVENAGGATVRADINNILLAIQSSNSGVSAPSTTYAGMLWLETPASGNYTLKIRDKGNNHWLTLGVVTDPAADDEMGMRLLQGAASKTHIKRSDGTVLLAESGANVATLTNVVLGAGSQPASAPLLAMLASSTGITRGNGAIILSEDGSNVATLNNLMLGPGSGATDLRLAAAKLTADGRLERSDGTDILIESSNVATLKNVTLESSAVFPAGHIVQAAFSGASGATSVAYDTGSAVWGTYLEEIDITSPTTGNELIIVGQTGGYVNGAYFLHATIMIDDSVNNEQVRKTNVAGYGTTGIGGGVLANYIVPSGSGTITVRFVAWVTEGTGWLLASELNVFEVQR